MLTNRVINGLNGTFRNKDGVDLASGSLSVIGGQGPHGLGDMQGTVSVDKDRIFVRRLLGETLIFSSALEPDVKLEVILRDLNGCCDVRPIFD